MNKKKQLFLVIVISENVKFKMLFLRYIFYIKIKKIIRNNNIKYNNKYLDEIYENNDKSLYLTFKAKKMYKVNKGITIKLNYDFRRNKGYLYSDINNLDYEYLISLIEESINNGALKEYPLKKINELNDKEKNSLKKFIEGSK